MEKREIAPGLNFTFEETVTKEKTAAMIGSGLLEVYSTPSMIALMENTSYQCVQQYLDEGQGTVGSEVNIRHLKPTAVSQVVKCVSEVIEVEGKKIVFSVEVFEGEEKIGTGVHTRYIIDVEKFLGRLSKK